MNEELITPKVNNEAEFLEIVNDFGDPLELIREAISNAFDHGARNMKISCTTEPIDGDDKLVITLIDDGNGMTRDVLREAFWGLGNSTSRGKAGKIGEKGHGTKIFLRSEKVEVWTRTNSESNYSYCDKPHAALFVGKLHQPKLLSGVDYPEPSPTGTKIRIVGYNNNDRSRFTSDIVTDYIRWFTKIGSVEREFGITGDEDFKLQLKCIRDAEFKPVEFGHVFAKEDEEKTREQERTEFERRKKFVLKRPIAKLGERLIVEPASEAEVFGLFVNLYCLHPGLFDFEPVDYNTKLGIDMIAKNKNDTSVTEQDYWYVEFKNLLDPKFNHAFRHVRFIVCWDFGRGVDAGTTEFRGVEEDDVRKMSVARMDGKTSYFLDNPYRRSHKIEVIRLKEFLKERLKIEFAPR